MIYEKRLYMTDSKHTYILEGVYGQTRENVWLGILYNLTFFLLIKVAITSEEY